MYYLQKFERYPKWDWYKIICNGFLASFGFSSRFNPKSNAHRIVIAFKLMSTIILTTVLSARVIFLLINPAVYHQIQSVQEIIVGDFQLVIDRFVFQKVLQQNEVKKLNFFYIL